MIEKIKEKFRRTTDKPKFRFESVVEAERLSKALDELSSSMCKLGKIWEIEDRLRRMEETIAVELGSLRKELSQNYSIMSELSPILLETARERLRQSNISLQTEFDERYPKIDLEFGEERYGRKPGEPLPPKIQADRSPEGPVELQKPEQHIRQ